MLYFILSKCNCITYSYSSVEIVFVKLSINFTLKILLHGLTIVLVSFTSNLGTKHPKACVFLPSIRIGDVVKPVDWHKSITTIVDDIIHFTYIKVLVYIVFMSVAVRVLEYNLISSIRPVKNDVLIYAPKLMTAVSPPHDTFPVVTRIPSTYKSVCDAVVVIA